MLSDVRSVSDLLNFERWWVTSDTVYVDVGAACCWVSTDVATQTERVDWETAERGQARGLLLYIVAFSHVYYVILYICFAPSLSV